MPGKKRRGLPIPKPPKVRHRPKKPIKPLPFKKITSEELIERRKKAHKRKMV